jgi:hypothetical protein
MTSAATSGSISAGMTSSPAPGEQRNTFAEQARQQRSGLVAELVDFLKHNKKWWLTPIVLVLLIVGALIMLSGTAVAPFIYTLF